MRLLPAAEFGTDIPDDDGEVERVGHEVQSGRSVAGALREMLKRQEFKCDRPDYGGDHGWEFLCRSRGRDLWVSVIAGSEAGYYLTVRNMPWTPFLFWKNPPPAFDHVLTQLDEAMKSDGRFHEIRWGQAANIFSRSFESAPTPLG